MSDDIIPGQDAVTDLEGKVDRQELLEKLRRLEERRAQVELDKKNASASYNDELKAIKDEINDTLLILKDRGAPVDDSND